jgi:hypothetical protein
MRRMCSDNEKGKGNNALAITNMPQGTGRRAIEAGPTYGCACRRDWHVGSKVGLVNPIQDLRS